MTRKITRKQKKAMVKSYVRSLLVAIGPLLVAGATDPKAYAAAVAAAMAAVTVRYLDASDKAFGRRVHKDLDGVN